jgi:protocatechuate 3,4-dioxygenase beta subunit
VPGEGLPSPGAGDGSNVPDVLELAKGGSPFAGVAVYVRHCDRAGRYSLYSDGIENENYLRGVQVADADGRVRYTSVFPACYDGRWPHHGKIMVKHGKA